VVSFRQGQVIRPVGSDQILRLLDDVSEPVPGNDLVHGGKGIIPGLPGAQQSLTDPGEQPHLVVDGSGIVLKGGGSAPLGPSEQLPDRPVEDADGLVGQARHGLQHRHHQDGAAPVGRKRLEMLGGQPRPFAGELLDPVGMDGCHDGGVDPDPSKVPQLIDQTGQGAMSGSPG
jgi:hypothetical protein